MNKKIKIAFVIDSIETPTAGTEKQLLMLRESVATVTQQQVEEIAKQKMVDLNANDLVAACKIIAGTARSMGIDID